MTSISFWICSSTVDSAASQTTCSKHQNTRSAEKVAAKLKGFESGVVVVEEIDGFGYEATKMNKREAKSWKSEASGPPPSAELFATEGNRG